MRLTLTIRGVTTGSYPTLKWLWNNRTVYSSPYGDSVYYGDRFHISRITTLSAATAPCQKGHYQMDLLVEGWRPGYYTYVVTNSQTKRDLKRFIIIKGDFTWLNHLLASIWGKGFEEKSVYGRRWVHLHHSPANQTVHSFELATTESTQHTYCGML